MNIHHHDETTKVIHGDCIETMNAMPPESVDAIVTDPPYGLGFMGKKWDDLPPSQEWAEACYRVLKPGGHIAAFGGTRTWHRLAVAIEDAGFEMRDSLAWLYGSGFPKSHNVGKSTATDEWGGWGTALKPAFEPIVLARKPFKGTVAGNVLTHGTGAINIDACRIESGENLLRKATAGGSFLLHGARSVDELRALAAAGEKTPDGRDAQATLARALTAKERVGERVQPSGRWPANVLLDHHAATWVDEQSGHQKDGVAVNRNRDGKPRGVSSWALPGEASPDQGYGGSGGASRFFYTAKAPKRERPNVDGVQHPTVKPLAIMEWLIRLVTPPGGTVLDPFVGSGTTLEAARKLGFKSIGIEAEESYLQLIDQRLQGSNTIPTENT